MMHIGSFYDTKLADIILYMNLRSAAHTPCQSRSEALPLLGEAKMLEVSDNSSSRLLLRLLPSLTSLIYPLLVWTISAVSPILLVLTVLPLLASVACVVRIGPSNRYPRAIAVAYFGVCAPALYSLMGGWLDFQKVLPFHADSAWIALWSAFILLVAIERPNQFVPPIARNSSLALAHGVSAAIIVLFALFHLTNHLVGLAGGEAHIAVMKTFRIVYRQPVVETLLATAVLFQVVTGIILLRRRPMSSDLFEITQGVAGAYLVGFFASHLSAVVHARYLKHIDTNWFWLTDSNLFTDEWSSRLVPYYFLGIVALGIHGSCGLRHILLKHGRVSFARVAFWGLAAGTVSVALAAITGIARGSLHS